MRARSMTTTHTTTAYTRMNTRTRSMTLTLTLTSPTQTLTRTRVSLETLPVELLLHIVRLASLPLPQPKGYRLDALSDSDSETNDRNSTHCFFLNSASSSTPVAAPVHLDTRTLRALTRTSTTLAAAANAILYATFCPRDANQLSLFTLTAAASPNAFTLARGPQPATATAGKTRVIDTKYTHRLILTPPPPSAAAGRMGSQLRPGADAQRRARERFVQATRALLFPTATGVSAEGEAEEVDTVLSYLRTLLVDAELLEEALALGCTSSTTNAQGIRVHPNELILSTYLRVPRLAMVNGPTTATTSEASPLAHIAERMTHLVIAAPPTYGWRAPRETLKAFGVFPFVSNANAGARSRLESGNETGGEFGFGSGHHEQPRSRHRSTSQSKSKFRLTNLALPRRAHANQENDDEFVADVRQLLGHEVDRSSANTESEESGDSGGDSGLEMLILAIVPDSGFAAWCQLRLLDADTNAKEGSVSGSAMDEDEYAQRMASLRLRLLEEYLSASSIWKRLAELVKEYSSPISSSSSNESQMNTDSHVQMDYGSISDSKRRNGTNRGNGERRGNVQVCLVPAFGPAWTRAVRAHVPPPCSISSGAFSATTTNDNVVDKGMGVLNTSISISDAPRGVGGANGDVFVPSPGGETDLWAWARKYELGRRRREVCLSV